VADQGDVQVPAQPSGKQAAVTQQGVVVKYDPARGYGFIRPDGMSGQDIFVHIKNVTNAAALRPGQRVSYQVTSSAKGPAAVKVRAGSLLTLPHLRYMLTGLAGALVLFLVGSLWLKPSALPGWLALWAITSSVATYGIYRYDKLQSENGLGRVPEAVLLALAAVGGSAGALLGMHFPTRHKTAKAIFQAVYWLIVALQAGAVIFLLTRP
jgi:uncharacterized membrane protein YsdA (DUF1294 family)/cold shock CspA family protein